MSMFDEHRLGRRTGIDTSPIAEPAVPVMAAVPPAAVAPVGPAADSTSLTPTTGTPTQARLDVADSAKTLREPEARPGAIADRVVVGGALVTRHATGVTIDFGSSDPDAARVKNWSHEVTDGDRRVMVLVADARELPQMAGTAGGGGETGAVDDKPEKEGETAHDVVADA